MTELLKQAIDKLKTHPIREKDSIAALILEELQDDDDLGFSADRFRDSWKQAVAGNTLPLAACRGNRKLLSEGMLAIA
jgi:hypothetical protein